MLMETRTLRKSKKIYIGKFSCNKQFKILIYYIPEGFKNLSDVTVHSCSAASVPHPFSVETIRLFLNASPI